MPCLGARAIPRGLALSRVLLSLPGLSLGTGAWVALSFTRSQARGRRDGGDESSSEQGALPLLSRLLLL